MLNATAKPFLPRSSGSSIAQRVNRRRSRSTGSIIEIKNSQCETRTFTEKSIIQQGEEKETSVKDVSSQILKSLTDCDSRSPTLKRLKELCKEKSLKVSGRKEELKIRLRKHLETSQNQDGGDAEENSSKMAGRKEELKIPKKHFKLSQIQDGGVSRPGKYKVKKQPEIQRRPPCLTAEETKRSAPAAVSNPIFSENEEEYEADDEDEILQQRQRQGPKPTSSPCESHKRRSSKIN